MARSSPLRDPTPPAWPARRQGRRAARADPGDPRPTRASSRSASTIASTAATGRAAVTEALEELRRATCSATPRSSATSCSRPPARSGSASAATSVVAPEQRIRAGRRPPSQLLAEPERPRSAGPPRSRGWRCSPTAAAPTTCASSTRATPAVVTVDFRFLAADERTPAPGSSAANEHELQHRLVWVVGEPRPGRSRSPASSASRGDGQALRRPQRVAADRAPPPPRPGEDRSEELEKRLRAVTAAWMAGRCSSAAKPLSRGELGAHFATPCVAAGERCCPICLPALHHHEPDPRRAHAADRARPLGPLAQAHHDLKILELDNGRYEPDLRGLVPSRSAPTSRPREGIGGDQPARPLRRAALRLHPNVVKACVAGLLRGGKVRIQSEAATPSRPRATPACATSSRRTAASRARRSTRSATIRSACAAARASASSSKIAWACASIARTTPSPSGHGERSLPSRPTWSAFAAEYTAERKRLLQWQNQQCDHARATLRARPGFSTLTARPVAQRPSADRRGDDQHVTGCGRAEPRLAQGPVLGRAPPC
jgi:hypothetical protein